MGFYEDAYKYAIKNAALHAGKASVGAVVGKVKALNPDLEIKDAMPSVIDAVKKVNSMKMPEIEKEFKAFEEKGYELKPKEKEGFLPALEWAEKEQVVTRYAPNPNGPFHLGNARAAILSDEFAKIYSGKMILRFDDTDPKVKKPIENAEQIFKEDLEWLDCSISETYFASDRLEIYYKYMKKVTEQGNAYVCTCDSEKWRALIRKKQACPCRGLETKEQTARLAKMFSNEFKEKQAVLRIKTDLKNPDPSIRDWWAAKVVDNPIHPNPKTKGKFVWPSYNLASAIDDHELGVTLILRGQEHEQNQTKQEYLYKYLGWKYPHSFHFGRIKLGETILSTSKIKAGIEEGSFSGWDDPRLGTIRALRRRGFQAKALRNAILEVGVKSSDASIDGKRLADLNKDALGTELVRIAFFREPIILDVSHSPEKEVEVDGNTFRLAREQRFLVDKEELGKFKKGDVFRLRNAYDVKISKKDELQAFAEYIGELPGKKHIMQWILEGADIEILMDDASRIAGLAGEEILKEKEGTVVHFDRFGFCRIESIEGKKAKLIFTNE